jgi:hypothetical protein
MEAQATRPRFQHHRPSLQCSIIRTSKQSTLPQGGAHGNINIMFDNGTRGMKKFNAVIWNTSVHCNVTESAHVRSPRIRRASWMSLGMIVTRLA